MSEQGLWANMLASGSAGIYFLGVYRVPELNANREQKEIKNTCLLWTCCVVVCLKILVYKNLSYSLDKW